MSTRNCGRYETRTGGASILLEGKLSALDRERSTGLVDTTLSNPTDSQLTSMFYVSRTEVRCGWRGRIVAIRWVLLDVSLPGKIELRNNTATSSRCGNGLVREGESQGAERNSYSHFAWPS